MHIVDCRKGRISIQGQGRSWTLLRPADLESLWAALGEDDFGEDERVPYWTELWPASLALAQWLYEQRAALQGALCMDMGCGLGLTAMIGALLGARVLAFDYEPEALRYARKNMNLNFKDAPRPAQERPSLLWTVMDWRRPAIAKKRARRIWAGDIMYERRFVEPVAAFLDYALASDGTVWIAEPGRNIYKEFHARMLDAGWSVSCVKNTGAPSFTPEKTMVSVQIWELRRI